MANNVASDNWEKQEVLRLIELYEQETVLWNVKLSAHKNCNTRHDAISKIANALGRSEMEVDKKIKTIRSQFFREKNKVVRSQKSGAGTDEVYAPKWSFFKLLTFLTPSVDPVAHSSSMNLNLSQDGSIDTQTDDHVEDDAATIDSQDVEEEDLMGLGDTPPTAKKSTNKRTTEEGRATSSNTSKQSEPNISTKRSRSKNQVDGIEKKMNEAYDIMKSSANKKRDQDTCFGEFVTESLRNISDPRIKSWARREISNILYQAETGMNDAPLSTAISSGSSYSQGPHITNRLGYQTGAAANQFIQQPQQINQVNNPYGNFNTYDSQFTNVGQQLSSSRGTGNYFLNVDQQQHQFPNPNNEMHMNSQLGEKLHDESRPLSI